MSTYERKPGRPRQPWCPTCRKEGTFVQKYKAYGYCKDHKAQMSRTSYVNRMKEQAANYVHPEDLVVQLERDLHAYIEKWGRENVTVQFIQNAFEENGLPVPGEEAIRREFLPDSTPRVIDYEEDRSMIVDMSDDEIRRALLGNQ